MLPSSAKTEISLENKKVAVVVDACHYYSASFAAYFSKEDSLKNIEQITRGVKSVFAEKNIDYEVIPLPFFCVFTGGFHEKDLRDKKGGVVIGSMKNGPYPVAQRLSASEQNLRDSYLKFGCQGWQYRQYRLGERVVSVNYAANLYQCKKKGHLKASKRLVDVIPDLEKFDYVLTVNSFLVSATLARVLITLDDGPLPSYSSAAVFSLKQENFVWDDFRNLRSKCWATDDLAAYPTVTKVLGGLVCEK